MKDLKNINMTTNEFSRIYRAEIPSDTTKYLTGVA